MPTIEKISGKTGNTYRISVSAGVDSQGKRIRHRMMWKPTPGMTARQEEKAVQRAAIDFERSIEQGYVLDQKQTFAEYATYVLNLKERDGTKAKTLDRYRELMIRINQAIGHIKLADLRPQHLNAFYKNLMEPGIRLGAGIATTKIDLAAWLKQNKKTRAGIAEVAGVAASTVSAAAQGKPIQETKAVAIANAMGKKTNEVYRSRRILNADEEPRRLQPSLLFHGQERLL